MPVVPGGTVTRVTEDDVNVRITEGGVDRITEALSAAVWDNTAFGCPEARDYQPNFTSLQRVGEPIDGASRFRKVREEGFIEIPIQVPQTPAQYLAFRDFYFNTIDAGAGWFTMPLLLGLVTETLIVHIRDGYRQSRNTNVYGYYNLNFELDAVRIPSQIYTPPVDDIIDATGPANPQLGTLDIIDAAAPDNPSLGTLDQIDPNPIIGLPV